MHLFSLMILAAILFVCVAVGRPDAFNILLVSGVLGAILASAHQSRARVRRKKLAQRGLAAVVKPEHSGRGA